MKDFFVDRPGLAGLFAFLLVTGVGSILGILLGMWAMFRETAPCKGPCDGAAMAAGFIWTISFTISLIAGLIAGGIIFVVMKKSRDKLS